VKRRYLAVVVLAAISATAGQVPAAAATPDAWGQAAAHATGDYYNAGETRLTPAATQEYHDATSDLARREVEMGDSKRG